MKLLAVNGHARAGAPWRGGLVVRGRDESAGALIDPTGSVSARLLMEPELRHACGLDRPTLPVLLTRAHIDQIGALIELRHGSPVELYTTPALFEALSSATAVWPALQARSPLHWRMVPLGGDHHEAEFRVEGQTGTRYTAVLCSSDAVEARAAHVLLARDLHSGAQVAWVRGDSMRMALLDEALQFHWDTIRWVVLGQAGDPEHLGDDGIADEALAWLMGTRAPNRLLLGGTPEQQELAQAAGVVVAQDGLEILVD